MFHRMRNLGEASARRLRAAGIHSEQQLRHLGSVVAFTAVQRAGCAPSLNLLWALEGALTGEDWRHVARHHRTALLLRLEDHPRAPR